LLVCVIGSQKLPNAAGVGAGKFSVLQSKRRRKTVEENLLLSEAKHVQVSSYPHKIQVVRNCVPLFSFAFDNWYANIILDNYPLLWYNKSTKTFGGGGRT